MPNLQIRITSDSSAARKDIDGFSDLMGRAAVPAAVVGGAMLAMAGDLGGAFGPSLVGTVTQQAGDNLQSGMLVGSIFPLVLIIALVLLNRKAKK